MREDLPTFVSDLTSRIECLTGDATVNEFMETLGLKSWDAGSSGGSYAEFTWELADGYCLHALIDTRDGAITNRFGAAGVSVGGEIVWSANPTKTNCHEHDLQCAAVRHNSGSPRPRD